MARRPDGYHEIETVLYPIGWKDALEAVPSDEFRFQKEGGGGWPMEDELCMKAYHALEQVTDVPPVDMFLLKNIPHGAGLGGGSSDAAATLGLVNTLCELGLSASQLHELAAQLGTDCPFFLHREPMLAAGIGTDLEPVAVHLTGLHLLVVVPDVLIDTKWAYANVKPRQPRKPLHDVISQPIATWREELTNDFEEPVFATYPQIAALKTRMYEAGAVYASLSGSGSAVYGLFGEEPRARDFGDGVKVFTERLG